MGEAVVHSATIDVVAQINLRLSMGDGIEEMVALHKEFRIFSTGRSLSDICALLNVGPHGPERQRWYKYLDQELRKYGSDIQGQNGHDRVLSALRENLESKTPLPVFFTLHAATRPPAVRVLVDAPIVYSSQKHLVVSIPTIRPRRLGRPAARPPGRKSGKKA